MKIMDGKYTPISSDYSADLSDLVVMCLEIDPTRRASMEKILSLPSVLDQAHQLTVAADAPGEKSTAPSRVRAWRKWRKISSSITKLYEEVVRDLDAPTL